MITNEHIEQYLAQAHRYGDAKLMLCSSGESVKKRLFPEQVLGCRICRKRKYPFVILLRVRLKTV
jgi:hypothetical protein